MNSTAVLFFKEKFSAMGHSEIAAEVARKNDLSDEALHALESVLEDRGLSVAVLEKFAVPIPQQTISAEEVYQSEKGKASFKKILLRIMYVILGGVVGALPGVIGSIQPSGALWYTLLLYFFSSVGSSLIGIVFGTVVLITRRDRTDGGLKLACFISLLFGLLSTFLAFRYG